MALRFSAPRGASAIALKAMVRGPVGATGTAATITAGTTTTGVEGSSATVTNSCTSSAAVFDFAIPRGTAAAIGFNFSTTTTDSDPGNGVVRFNNATPASVTEIYFDNLDRDGNTVTAWLNSFDDSTDTVRGTLTFTATATPSTKLIFNVSGSVTDGTGYRKVTVSHVAGTTLPTNGAHLATVFTRTGNAGTNGEMTGPGVSVNGEIALYNGTSGTTLKRASTTGILKASSGVLTAAVSSTDYAPATSGSAILKGNGSGGFSSASAGTDYVAPGGALGTPSSGDLTNCTGLPVAGITGSTSTALGVGSLELGNASDTTLSRSAAGIVAVEGVVMKNTGKETIFVPATAMVARSTNGAASGTVEQTTNKNMVRSLDFDTTTQEFAQFQVWFPKSWNLGTVTFQPTFSQASTAAGGVVFGLAGVAVSDGDSLDVAFGTAQTSTKTAGTANLEYQGPESSAITIAGTPAAGDRVMFQINRTVSDGSDTLAQDARLHGVRLFFTTNAATDA